MCFAPGRFHEAIERRADVDEGVREEVAVGVERDVDRSVAELRLEQLGMRTGGDHEGGVGVPEVVEAEWREPGTADGGAEDPGHEVVFAPDGAARRGEDEAKLVRGAGEQLLAEDARCFA